VEIRLTGIRNNFKEMIHQLDIKYKHLIKIYHHICLAIKLNLRCRNRNKYIKKNKRMKQVLVIMDKLNKMLKEKQ
jgi:hypothetical protein